MKTIKQIASELGEPKQRVYRFALRQKIEPVEQRGKTWYYDEAGEKQIKQAVYEANEAKKLRQETHQQEIDVDHDANHKNDAKSDLNSKQFADATLFEDTPSDSNISAQIIRTVDLLSQQLSEKDRQIADLHQEVHELNDRLHEAHELLDQQQRLQIHQAQVLTSGQTPSDAVDAEAEPDEDQPDSESDQPMEEEEASEPEVDAEPEEEPKEEAVASTVPEPSVPEEQKPKKSFWSRLFGS